LRIGVLSDTHGRLTLARKAVPLMGDIQLLIHAGDFYHDALKLGGEFQLSATAVIGNCDLGVNGPKEEQLDVGEMRIFITHGHLYRAKSGLLNLYLRAKELGADVVIFGHTHVPEIEYCDGICLFNPGSISLPRGRRKPTFGILELEKGKPKPRIINLE
jgi:putative phosphoesterase